MSAAERLAGRYRVQAYKQVVGDDNAVRIAPCMCEEADHWWIEQMIGPDRWSKVEKKDTEQAAVRRFAELTSGAPMSKTHYGYSTPRI